eukprot:TRINITY_DN89_c0_g1_i3.p1 TRINITY_DN89_c0_g1~~TRINITY_DN89_c0_g1_i3.p1  ORF type:complete len:228 (-),score=36.61 TRINITY_DN89_c0_g1_i3:462-1145(-)
MINRKPLYILFSLCIFIFSNAQLVTKNMHKPRVASLESVGLSGKLFAQKNGVPEASALPPVVMIPGVGGSQLKAKLNNANHHFYCSSKSDWYRIWLSLEELLPGPPEECWSDNIQLTYDPNTQTYSNATNVEIEAEPIGDTTSFEYLDPNFPKTTIYFADVVQSLVNIGYVRGENLIGAPYDWRLAAPQYMPQFYEELQQTIENAFEQQQSGVVIIAHSMGNIVFTR